MNRAYYRVSTKGQEDNGYGLDEQHRAVSEFLGSEEVISYTDAGVSGETLIRPGLAKLLLEVESGDRVVVPRLDRLARSLVVQELLLDQLTEKKAEVLSCVEAESVVLMDDEHDPTRRLIRQVLGAVAEFERGLITARLQAGRRAKHQRGGYAYGAPPFGYASLDGVLTPIEDEQRVILFMRSRSEEGASNDLIASELNISAVRTRYGGHWHGNTVRRILRREGRAP